MSIKSFKTNTARDIFLGDNTKAARKIARTAWPSASHRLQILNMAARLSDVAQTPGVRLEPIKHSKPGFYSLRVNNQYRITFRFEDGNAYDVNVEDPLWHQP
ncbi:MAG: type II toxin-antitoxin system RelE/ParE family toxin [Acidobacteriota bacterium]|nr:type II toxin-antitoxin system RelE/ParE family toxin [Acidobacteriota bacterium]